MTNRGKLIRLFLVDGTPGGLTALEITNWTGLIVAAPRSQMKRLSERQEVQRPGVYLLLGEDDAAEGGIRCYIGETDEIRMRLAQHNSGPMAKEFWTRVVSVTSKDDNLTKSHVRYLESRLVELATRAKRCTLENGNNPPAGLLPEADASDMEFFIDQLQVGMPVLGINIFRVPETSATPVSAPTESGSPVFHLTIEKRDVHARAQLIDGEFTVLEGSTVVPKISANAQADSTQRQYQRIEARRDRLVAEGALRADPAGYRFAKNVVFNAPSTAAAVVKGRSTSGRTSWVTEDGQTFGEWEDSV